ncbi:MAG: hypothetical protein R3C05_08295 [Pirellulaceae bacterium]
MGESTTTDDTEIWLPAELRHKSQWISSVIDTRGWTYDDEGSPSNINHLLRRQLEIEPEMAVDMVLRMPKI